MFCYELAFYATKAVRFRAPHRCLFEHTVQKDDILSIEVLERNNAPQKEVRVISSDVVLQIWATRQKSCLSTI